MAPAAHLVIQSSLDAANGLQGIPANINNLLQPVYDTDGVRVHNNSWGVPAFFSNYTAVATPRQVDEFVYRNPDMVVVFAAGNAGTDGPLNAVGPLAVQDGISDLSTLNPEATLRNGIAVGGSENNRPAVALVWNVLWATGSRFFAAPLAADPVADNAAHLMAFSGRGPTTPASGRRLKPDICAPGSSIFSAFSSLSATSNFWGVRPAGSPYIFMGGTSMAAPHVTGMAVLVREYLRRIHHIADKENPVRRLRRPSAALVKALICHGGVLVNGMYGAAPQDNHGPQPSNHQGWGRADLRRSLFSNPIAAHAAADPTHLPRRTIFIDDPTITLNGLPAANPISRTLREVQVQVMDNSVPLRATLVWTDYPGPAGHPGTLVNRLQLSIRRYNANGTTTDFAIANPAGILPATMDPRTNNVQQIDLSGANLVAAAGTRYGIRVSAVRINSFSLGRREEQDFALVVSGPISHSDHKVPGTIAALPDLAFVDLEDTAGVRNHDGLAPSPPRPTGNPGSPDIWVSRENNPDPAKKVETIEVGQPHFVFVKVRNLGFAAATGAQVNVYWADRTQPFTFPADWKTAGFKVDGVTGNQRQVDVPARGETVAGPFEWDPPRGFEQLELLVRATHPDDPIVNEGDVRYDNNITGRDVTLADNSTHVGGTPGKFDRFVFWLISGFSSPRDIEANMFLSFQDIRDGQVKPLPGGLDVEVFDFDPVSGDDKMGQTRTLRTTLPDGKPATHAHLTFSTIESGEGSPDIYFRIPKPTGPEFADFIAGSFFASGADAWSSKSQPDASGGFFADDFDGNQIGIPVPLQLVIRPVGIHVRAVFEFFSGSEYRPLPADVPVRIVDAGNPEHVFVTPHTDAHGEINTVVARGDSKPDLAFRILKSDAAAKLAGVDFFASHDTFDSASGQVEVLAADGSVASTQAGRFDDVDRDELVPAGQKLRLRLESPGIHVNVRFEYFDREAGGVQPVPEGTEVEVWEDAATATQPLVRGVVGPNGRAELAVPRGDRASFDLFVRLVMRRRLGPDVHAANAPAVAVTKGGTQVRFDTKGQTATDGTTSGRFANVATQVPAAGAPPTFRIGAAADPDDEHAAPYVLRVIGEVDAWLRTRSANDWTGVPTTTVDLFTSGAEGSRPDLAATTVHLNFGHTAAGAPQPDHWSRPVIAHQFAHLVIDKLFASLAHGGAVLGNHEPFNPRAQQVARIALTEGFAEYVVGRHVSAPVRPDTSPQQTGWRGADNDGTKRHAETVPIAIANALWRVDDEVVGLGAHSDHRPDQPAPLPRAHLEPDQVAQRLGPEPGRVQAVPRDPVRERCRCRPARRPRHRVPAPAHPRDLRRERAGLHARTDHERHAPDRRRAGRVAAAARAGRPGEDARRRGREDHGVQGAAAPSRHGRVRRHRPDRPGHTREPARAARPEDRRGPRDGRSPDGGPLRLARPRPGRSRYLGHLRRQLHGQREPDQHERSVATERAAQPVPRPGGEQRAVSGLLDTLSSLIGGASAPAAVRAPVAEVAVGGGSADDWAKVLVSLSVEAAAAPAVGAVELVVGPGGPGAAVGDTGTVKLGYGDDGPDDVFAGAVHAVHRNLDGSVRVVVADAAAPLAAMRLNQSYEQRSAGEIVKDLAGQAGVSVDRADDGPKLPFYVVDDRSSAWVAHRRPRPVERVRRRVHARGQARRSARPQTASRCRRSPTAATCSRSRASRRRRRPAR